MKLRILSVLLFLPFLVNAQASDQKAKAILDEVIKKSRSYETIRAEFTYKLENKKNKVSDGYQGTVLIKGDNYRLTIAGQTVIFNNNTVWTYIKSAHEVQINSVEENDDAVTPTRILTGTYLKQFKPKLMNDAVRGGRNLHVIDLTPLQGKSFFKVRVEIDKANSQIVSFVVYDKNGSTYSYLISKFQTNLKLNDSEFVFKASEFPGAEINDMR